mmetsp:Transcript_67986/g.180942  ORF Transcript_67986/g.180942 Transcript_67986/m.180942 type:complete len:234 (-) Transcript_67986:8-709(-)
MEDATLRAPADYAAAHGLFPPLGLAQPERGEGCLSPVSPEQEVIAPIGCREDYAAVLGAPDQSPVQALHGVSQGGDGMLVEQPRPAHEGRLLALGAQPDGALHGPRQDARRSDGRRHHTHDDGLLGRHLGAALACPGALDLHRRAAVAARLADGRAGGDARLRAALRHAKGGNATCGLHLRPLRRRQVRGRLGAAVRWEHRRRAREHLDLRRHNLRARVLVNHCWERARKVTG